MFELFRYSFMQNAFMAVIAISFFAPLLGIFLILRRQSLLSDTLSHVSLAGVALGLLIGVNPTWTTIFVVVLIAIFLEFLRAIYKNYMELSTALLMSAGLAIALIVLSANGNGSGISLDQYLFGSIVTISQSQVFFLFCLAAIILIALSLSFKALYLVVFDEDTARVDGLPVRSISTIFNIITGVAIALMIPAVGALLVSAIVVMPAAIALLIGESFKTVLLFAVLISLIGLNLGLLISYYSSAPASAVITLLFIGILFLVILARRLLRNK